MLWIGTDGQRALVDDAGPVYISVPLLVACEHVPLCTFGKRAIYQTTTEEPAPSILEDREKCSTRPGSRLGRSHLRNRTCTSCTV